MRYFSEVIFSPRKAIFRLFFFIIGAFLVLWGWKNNFFSPASPKILFLIDNSLSMTVPDISTDEKHFLSRLESAKILAERVSDAQNAEMAIATFSRDFTLLMPFSRDKILQKNVISGISPIIYGGGSDIFSSLSHLTEMYRSSQNVHIFVLTDAEFFEKPSKNFEKSHNIHIHIIATGTQQWGMMLLWYDSDGKPKYREFDGKIAISSVNESSLAELKSFFSADVLRLEKESDIFSLSEYVWSELTKTAGWNQYFFSVLWGIFLLFAIIFPIYERKKPE